MRAELANLNHCAVPFPSRAAANLCWYYMTDIILHVHPPRICAGTILQILSCTCILRAFVLVLYYRYYLARASSAHLCWYYITDIILHVHPPRICAGTILQILSCTCILRAFVLVLYYRYYLARASSAHLCWYYITDIILHVHPPRICIKLISYGRDFSLPSPDTLTLHFISKQKKKQEVINESILRLRKQEGRSEGVVVRGGRTNILCKL